MNLNNSKYNYARKFKAILKYVLFAVPLIMVLVAVLFPIKTSINYYDGSTSELTDTISGVYYNQLIYSKELPPNAYSLTFDNDYTLSYDYTDIPIGTRYVSIFSMTTQSNHKYYLKWKNDTSQVSLRTASIGDFSYIGIDAISSGAKIINGTGVSSDITLVSSTYTYGSGKLYFNLVDMSLMFGLGNEPTTTADFEVYCPRDLYNSYDSGTFMLKEIVSTTITINDTDKIWYTEDKKTLNTTLLTPMTEFYGASINSWYESFLTAFELDYDTTSYMYYLVHMPLWIMYVVLLDLLLDIVLLVPCLLHNLVYKYKGDE